jgi:DNA polymerase
MSGLSDLAIMIRQLRTELEWAARTGIVPPAVEAPKADEPPPVELDPVEEATEAQPIAEPPPVPHDAPLLARAEEPRRPAPDPVPIAPPRAPEPALPSTTALLRVLAKCDDLDEIREVLGDCTRCKLARMGRTQVVYGVGNPKAEVMFVGEAPGHDEDQQGEPFVGKAGQLLTRIIEGGLGMKRSDVYIANILKCRPPQNRDPEADEVAACRGFVEAQIRVVRPKLIVTLGRHATQTLLATDVGMTKLRGKWQSFRGIPVMPTFHPAYVLRNPEAKRPVWEDVQEVLRHLGRPAPASKESS